MNKLLKKQKLQKTSWTDYKHQNNICIFIKKNQHSLLQEATQHYFSKKIIRLIS